MFCSKCGTLLNDNEKYCHCCGKAVETDGKIPEPVEPTVSGSYTEPVMPSEPLKNGTSYDECDSGIRSSAGLIAFSVVNIILGLFSCCCYNPLPVGFGIASLILSIISQNESKEKSDSHRQLSLIFNIIAVVLSAIMLILIIILSLTGNINISTGFN